MIQDIEQLKQELLKAKKKTDFYKRLEEGKQYEDFITDLFRLKFGIVISTYSSYKYQKDKGENAQGIEIKLDKGFRNTGNLFIEIEEEGHPAGILKNDNTLFYIQGDHKIIFWFTLKDLKEVYASNKYKVVDSWNNVRGFLYPINEATKKAITRIDL